jgi:hypothetical protein
MVQKQINEKKKEKCKKNSMFLDLVDKKDIIKGHWGHIKDASAQAFQIWKTTAEIFKIFFLCSLF